MDLKGSLLPNGPDCQLILTDCQTTIGMGSDAEEENPAYLGALSIKSSKGVINFRPEMHIRDLKLALGDSTDVYRLSCQVGKFHIQAADNAEIIISGENIRKLLETNKAESK